MPTYTANTEGHVGARVSAHKPEEFLRTSYNRRPAHVFDSPNIQMLKGTSPPGFATNIPVPAASLLMMSRHTICHLYQNQSPLQ